MTEQHDIPEYSTPPKDCRKCGGKGSPQASLAAPEDWSPFSPRYANGLIYWTCAWCGWTYQTRTKDNESLPPIPPYDAQAHESVELARAQPYFRGAGAFGAR